MPTTLQNKLDNDIRDTITEAKLNGASEEEIYLIVNGISRDIEEYGLEEAIRPNEWLQ